MSATEMLPFLLKQLRLPAVSSHWQERVDFAQKNQLSYGDFLADVLELEVALREQKRLAQAYKNAKLPIGKTLASFDFSKTASINAPQIQHLTQDRKWIDDVKNLVLFGPSGVGKTHIAAAIGYGLLELGVKVLFSPTTLLVQSLQRAKSEFKLEAALDKIAKYHLLILDDIGYVKKSEKETSVLFELIAHRYESGSLLITANQPFSQWDNLFPDKMMAVAAIDRIVHHATIIQINGESFRANYAKEHNMF